jgi:Predicted nucleoside-diphosphate-sugar epimerases
MKALVTGASGYVGGRLVPRLLELGHDVTVIVRDPNRLNDVPWKNSVQVVVGDLKDRTAVDEAVAGQDLVYYLVHSMSQSRDFAQLERTIAQTVASACEEAGVGRIVYLGGLHPDGELSTHLQSRKEVGNDSPGEQGPDDCVPSRV